MNVLDKKKSYYFWYISTLQGYLLLVVNVLLACQRIYVTKISYSAFINYNGLRLVIDCGPDFRLQMINNKMNDIDAILITHGHRDHIAGIDDIRPFNFILGKVIHLYAKDEIMDQLDKEFPYILNSKRIFWLATDKLPSYK